MRPTSRFGCQIVVTDDLDGMEPLPLSTTIRYNSGAVRMNNGDHLYLPVQRCLRRRLKKYTGHAFVRQLQERKPSPSIRDYLFRPLTALAGGFAGPMTFSCATAALSGIVDVEMDLHVTLRLGADQLAGVRSGGDGDYGLYPLRIERGMGDLLDLHGAGARIAGYEKSRDLSSDRETVMEGNPYRS